MQGMMEKNKWWLLRAVMFLGLLMVPHRVNNDTWFLLNHGRYVMENGIPHIEPFTIHEGMHFVMQQWLSSVVFWLEYEQGGLEGLYLSCVAIAAVFILSIHYLFKTINSEERVIIPFVAVIGMMSATFMVGRPWIFSSLFLLWEVIFLEKYAIANRKNYLLALPVVSLLLINFHAAMWPMAFVMLLPYIAEWLADNKLNFNNIQQTRYSLSPILIAAMLMVIAACINPYGFEAMTYLTHSYGVDLIDDNINEMQPANIRDISGKKFFLLSAWMIVLISRCKISMRYVLLSLGTGYLAVTSIRGLMLFLLVGLLPAVSCINMESVDKYMKRENADSFSPKKSYTFLLAMLLLTALVYAKKQNALNEIIDKVPAVLLTVGLVALLAVIFRVLLSIRRYGLSSRRSYKAAASILLFIYIYGAGLMWVGSHVLKEMKEPKSKPAVEFLLGQVENKNSIRLWNGYGEGNYLEWRGIPCYIDARAEVFLEENNGQKNYLKEYFDLEDGKITYQEVLPQYKFTHILASKDCLLFRYLAYDGDYDLIFEDGNYRLYKVRGND